VPVFIHCIVKTATVDIKGFAMVRTVSCVFLLHLAHPHSHILCEFSLISSYYNVKPFRTQNQCSCSPSAINHYCTSLMFIQGVSKRAVELWKLK
jgi:hypothetical protein